MSSLNRKANKFMLLFLLALLFLPIAFAYNITLATTNPSLGGLGYNTNDAQIAQSFVCNMTCVRMFCTTHKRSGSPSGNIIYSIQTDNSDKPSGSNIKPPVNYVVDSWGTSDFTFCANFSVCVPCSTGTKYWVVINRTWTLSTSNYIGYYGSSVQQYVAGRNAHVPGTWSIIDTDLVGKLYENYTGAAAPPAITDSVNLFNFNKTNSFVKKSVFQENELFFEGINHTLSNGTILSDSECYVAFPSFPLYKANYNSTSKFYKSNASVSYSTSGIKTITIGCKNPNTDYNITSTNEVFIKNILPSVSFGVLNTPDKEYNLTDNISVEFAYGSWNWTPSVIDDDIDLIRWTFFDNDSNLIFTNSSRTLATMETYPYLFIKKGWYYYRVFVNDTDKNFTQKTMPFYLNDTISPYCDFFENASVFNGSTYYFNGTCTDENFYSINISCSNAHKFNRTKLNTSSFVVLDSLLVDSTSLSCTYEYCDAHTKKAIEDMTVTKSTNKNELKFDNTVLKFDKKLKDFSWKKDKDKYSFCVYPDKDTGSFINVDIPDGCEYYDSGIPGHLVCFKDRKWIDFVSDDVTAVHDSVNNKMLLQFKGNKDSYCFNSIGELNCNRGTVVFDVTVSPKNSTSRLEVNFCPDTTPGSLIVIAFLFFALLVMWMGIKFGIPMFGFFGGIILLVLSWTLIDCSKGVGYMIAGLGVMAITFFIFVRK